ncbi:MAG: HD domain-containing phosphohydrolase [bacterium]
MSQGNRENNSVDGYFSVYLGSLRIDSVLDFDLYISVGHDLVLYRSANLPFTATTRDSLLENKVTRLYVSAGDRHQFQQYVEANIRQILNDPSVDEFTKASIIYDSSKQLVEDLLSNPRLAENIQRSQAMVESTVMFILEGQSAFQNMVRVMSFDYSTYTHSVNVCTFALALARFTGIERTEELNRLGTGALLHDVGKTRIPESILNKQGPLTEDEMDIVRRHPQWGCEIIQETDLISEESYFPILQHHEREDKTGYPNGIGSNDVHLFSKIVSIADVFDAMTTKRVYRHAVDTYPALKEMYSLIDGFDRRLLDQFTHLMGPIDRQLGVSGSTSELVYPDRQSRQTE